MNLNNRFFRISTSLALVAVLALTWAMTAFAQLNTSKIEGTVRDKDSGQPLAGAQVVIEGTRLATSRTRMATTSSLTFRPDAVM